MTKQHISVLIAFLLVCTSVSLASSPLQTGSWAGPIKTPGGDLKIVFNISSEDGKTYFATCDSPDQGASDIPVESVVVSNDELTINIPAVNGKYIGTIQSDGKTIIGKWYQSSMKLDCTITCCHEKPASTRPQHPKPPFPYLSEEVTFPNKKAGVKLAGTLTLPETGGPFPAVILISGSGPNDRDETVFGHKPFLVLADYLTRNGLAVLRYDKRGIAKSTGDYQAATTIDFASDAAAGLDFLRSNSKIDKSKIGVIGHSEGGIIAPYLAAHRPEEIAFVVLLAAPGVPGKDLLPLQLEKILKLAGANEQELKTALNQQKEMFQIVLNEDDVNKTTELLNKEMEKRHNALSDEEKKASGMSLEAMQASAQAVNSPWFRCFLSHDPQSDLEKVTCPVLALWGNLDCQVPPEQNQPEIEKSLKTAGNSKVTFKTFDKMNHLFQTCETGSTNEYARITETISPDVLHYITNWMLQLY